MTQIEEILIGSDIEFFLQDKETKEIVSAEGIIKGTKYDPHHFDPNEKFFATSLDNVLAEGNIPPTTSASEFYENVEVLRKYINDNLPKQLETISIASARLDYKYLQTENSQIFGCEVSYNGWTNEMEHPQPTGDNLRSAGFHIHIGYKDPSEEKNQAIIRAMDLFLGIPSILIEPENERKSVGYGTAGNFRHKEYGCEFRSLSGYFASSKELIEWCFRNTQKAIDFVNSNRIIEICNLGEEIQQIINKEDKEMAKEFINRFELELI